MLWQFLKFYTSVGCRVVDGDKLVVSGEGRFDMPDQADHRLVMNDMKLPEGLASEGQSTFRSAALDSQAKRTRLEEQRDKLAKHLGTDDVDAITNEAMWVRLRSWILENMEKLLAQGYFGLPLQIRYNWCMFIVIQIPAQVIFPIPAAYKYLVPKKAEKVPIVKDALRRLDEFFTFVKKRSATDFLITFTIGRAGTAREDFDFILEIPKLIRSDPIKIIQWILKFQIKADGFV